MSRRARTTGDDGVALLEAAIVFPVIMMVILAVIEFGMLFSSTSTTTSSTRDGARYATAFYAVRSDKVAVGDEIRATVERDLGALTGQGEPVRMWVYRATPATGEPSGGVACGSDCLRYTWDTSTNHFVYDATSVPWSGLSVDACLPTLDEIGVMVEVRHDMLTGVIGSAPKTIRERTVLRLEPLPTSQCST